MPPSWHKGSFIKRMRLIKGHWIETRQCQWQWKMERRSWAIGMASRVCRTNDGHQESRVQMRKSYTREYKLKMVHFYHQNNLYQTSKRFSLNTKTIGHRSWVFPASLPIRRTSPTRGVYTSLNTWWPQITLFEKDGVFGFHVSTCHLEQLVAVAEDMFTLYSTDRWIAVHIHVAYVHMQYTLGVAL